MVTAAFYWGLQQSTIDRIKLVNATDDDNGRINRLNHTMVSVSGGVEMFRVMCIASALVVNQQKFCSRSAARQFGGHAQIFDFPRAIISCMS